MAGFLLASLPILALGLGGVEAAHWSVLRQTLSLALMEAARAGATRQARPQAIAQAFEHGLRMAYPDSRATGRALRERRAALGAPWRIRIARPSPDAFLDHADPDLQGPRDYPGQPLIRNDYQARQQARRLAQGWPEGRGPRSGLTIHEANTLVLELWWPHRPMVPGLAAIVRALAPLAGDPAQARLMAAGYLPFRRRAGVAMQSHPAAWPDLADGRVTHGAASGAPPGREAGPLEWNGGPDPASPPAAADDAPAAGTSAPGSTPGGGAANAREPSDPDAMENPEATAADPGGGTDSGTAPAACEPAP
ncbi:TadE/TadG family type IV pilus assembly protein [Castellaniella sp. WN]